MSATEKCIAILTGTFKEGGQNTPEFKEYSQRSAANGEANGGTLLGRYQVFDNLGQGPAPHAVFVIEFASRQIAEATFTNPEYLAIIPLRDVAFSEVKILLAKAPQD